MFWRKKEVMKWPFVLLAVLVLIVVAIIVGVILLAVLSKSNSLNTFSPTEQKAVEIKTSEMVRTNYIEEISGLKERILVETDQEKLFADVEQTLLSVSVPAEFRDAHLGSFLKFKALQRENLELSDSVLKVDELLVEIESLF